MCKMDRVQTLADPVLTEATMPSDTPQLHHTLKTNDPQQPKQQQPNMPKPKPKLKTNKTRKTQVAPLPATVEVRGYEITIPNTKTCWRVHVLYACRHPVMEISEVRYPGCDRPLVVEVNRHMRPCTEKCKVDGLEHVVGLCQACLQWKQETPGLCSVGPLGGGALSGADGAGDTDMRLECEGSVPQF